MQPRRFTVLTAGAAIVLLQALAIVAYLHVERQRERATGTPVRYEGVAGPPAPPQFDLVRADGGVVALRDLGGGPVLLHFWATWCPPCRDELPGLLRLGREQSGVRVIAVSVDEDWAAVERFFAGAVPDNVVRDPKALLAKHYGVTDLPDTYLIGVDGVARLRFAGARNWSSQAARDLLRTASQAGR